MVQSQRIGIVGLGLLGGSIGLALHKKAIAAEVCGFTRRRETLEWALNHKIITEGFIDFSEFLKRIDFLVLAAPVLTNLHYLEEIHRLKPELVCTDVGSTKEKIVKRADQLWGEKSGFVGAHPIAGSEKSGIRYACDDLFADRIVILTPGHSSRQGAVMQVRDFWQGLGGTIITMDAARHDVIVARTSHLPHVAAFILCRILQDKINDADYLACIGNGFRDATRIAKSDAEVWTEIFLTNPSIAEVTELFKKDLEFFMGLVRNKDYAGMRSFLEQARKIRDALDKEG